MIFQLIALLIIFGIPCYTIYKIFQLFVQSQSPTLNKRESKKFLEDMLRREREPISENDKKMAEEIKKNMKHLKVHK
jgi:hypothetical protein